MHKCQVLNKGNEILVIFFVWLSTKLSEKVKEFLADSNEFENFDKTLMFMTINSIESNN